MFSRKTSARLWQCGGLEAEAWKFFEVVIVSDAQSRMYVQAG